MCLLNDVCLIENEKLAPPTVGAMARVSARANKASKFEVHEYGDHYCCSS